MRTDRDGHAVACWALAVRQIQRRRKRGAPRERTCCRPRPRRLHGNPGISNQRQSKCVTLFVAVRTLTEQRNMDHTCRLRSARRDAADHATSGKRTCCGNADQAVRGHRCDVRSGRSAAKSTAAWPLCPHLRVRAPVECLRVARPAYAWPILVHAVCEPFRPVAPRGAVSLTAAFKNPTKPLRLAIVRVNIVPKSGSTTSIDAFPSLRQLLTQRKRAGRVKGAPAASEASEPLTRPSASAKYGRRSDD
jgi:hypothetical protein